MAKSKKISRAEISVAAGIGTATAALAAFIPESIALAVISAGAGAGLTQALPNLLARFHNDQDIESPLNEEELTEIVNTCIDSESPKSGDRNWYRKVTVDIFANNPINTNEILDDEFNFEMKIKALCSWYKNNTIFEDENWCPENEQYLQNIMKRCLVSLIAVEWKKPSFQIRMAQQTGKNTSAIKAAFKHLEEISIRIDSIEPSNSYIPIYGPNQIKEKLWIASQRTFFRSKEKGNRFHDLKIIPQLLPQGRISDKQFCSRGEKDDGTIAPLLSLCAETSEDIAIVGDGGIGKTTFLQQLLANEYLNDTDTQKEYNPDRPVLFFIELHRCPEHISQWYNDSLRKTNFITRYIGQLLEDHSSMDSVSPATLDRIEKEFQKTPKNGTPQYRLLLDGFNEVRSTQSIRTFLSNEITALHHYPNIQIITTSRETQAAYYASDFKNIRLIGLTEDDIKHHLVRCGTPQPVIGNVMNCKPLVKCLQIPLYLCMFTAAKMGSVFLPETAGEILYSFFYRNSEFYNVRQRISETMTNPLSHDQAAFVLDFVLPYVGWMYEYTDTFSVNADTFEHIITEAVQHVQMFLCSTTNSFSDFSYRSKILRQTYASFYDGDDVQTEGIILFLCDYLGIIYQDQLNEGSYADRVRYSFFHHHFRDFFSSMWDVQLLSMLNCITVDDFKDVNDSPSGTYQFFLNSHYWASQKVSFISQILMEHRNCPKLNPNTENWFLPEMTYQEQHTLSDALDFCKKLCKQKIDIHYLLQNILSAILDGRKELSGMDLQDLNFEHCCLFNVTCSKPGKSQILAANFQFSIFYDENFIPEDHRDSVMEYIYHDHQCFTIDDDGLIKCWDVLSGKLEYEFKSCEPLGNLDFSRKGFIKISPDGHWLATKVQESSPDGYHLYVSLYDLNEPDKPPIQITPTATHKILSFFGFTEDSKGLLMLCDYKTVYCYNIETHHISYSVSFDLLKQSELYAETPISNILAYTAEYDTYITDDNRQYLEYPEDDENTYFEEDESNDEIEDWDADEQVLPIPCLIASLDPHTGAMEILYSFTGAPQTSPSIAYNAEKHCFLLYNYDGCHFEVFDSLLGTCSVILEELTDIDNLPPEAIHQHPDCVGECYIVYADCIFHADYEAPNGGRILMKYSISGVQKLLSTPNHDGDLTFKPNVVPHANHFIVGDDTNTYEWDTVKETLNLKYNCVYYGCTDLFPSKNRSSFFLVHQSNGISIFGGSPIKLIRQYCFQEPGYSIGNCCHYEEKNLIAMTFASPSHEKVILLNIENSSQETAFSTLNTGESIIDLCFSENGRYLLITSQYQCLEFDTVLHTLSTVVIAGDNERLANGHFCKDLIEIAVVEHSALGFPRVEARCDLFQRCIQPGGSSPTYSKQWYYILPELTMEQRKYFITQNGDFGIESAKKEDGFQSYWVTRGFFLESMPEIMDILHPKCYVLQGDKFKEAELSFAPLEMISVRHTFALSSQYGGGNDNLTYMYLSDSLTEGVFAHDSARLSYQKNLHSLTYAELANDLKRNVGNHGNLSYWNFAIPDSDGNLIGCYESFNLIGIDVKTGDVQSNIEYTPAISIYECDFRNAQMSEDIRAIIHANGGKL